MNIADILVEKGMLKKEQVPALLDEAAELGISVEMVLIKHGVSPQEILKAKGEYLDVPTKNLGDTRISSSTLEIIPEESAKHYKFVPVGIRSGVLEVGMVDPDDISARDALNFIASKAHMPFKIFLISPEDFEKVISYYKGLSGEVNKALTELETELKIEDDKKPLKKKEESEEELVETEEKLGEEAPVTKIVATILRYATDGNASDIHIEPQRENVKVRFRIDGVLNTSLVLPMKVHSGVVARIKILSNMRLDEKRKPQDGRFTALIEGRKI